MILLEDQSEVVRFLSRPKTYGAAVTTVDTVETHISVVFLAGTRAFKLKRAVKYPYLDFSTLELRRTYCEAEVAVNRRTAPSLYLGVVAIVRTADGGLHLGGEGEIVDWLVEMLRFDEDTLFDRLAVSGGLDRHLMGALAETIARFHQAAEIVADADSRRGLRITVTGNAETFAEIGPGVFADGAVEALTQAQLAAIDGAAGDLLDARRAEGRVRHCHGDLHLRNICMIDGNPTLFDAIEFNRTFADIDVLYDLSFLLMDLEHRGLARLANIVFNRYLDVTADLGGLSCLGLFLSLRAAIRAHVEASTAARIDDRAQARSLLEEARAYLGMAQDALTPPAPVVIAVGGLSGSGKSRMARELAPYVGARPGARVARTDVLRKRLAGVDPLTRLDEKGYTREMTRKTYDAMYAETRRAIEQGHSAIADAVFANPRERKAIAGVAKDLGVPFHGLWLEAAPEVMAERVTGRKNNASDADASILARQLEYDLGAIAWTHIDSSGSGDQTLGKGLRAVGIAS